MLELRVSKRVSPNDLPAWRTWVVVVAATCLHLAASTQYMFSPLSGAMIKYTNTHNHNFTPDDFRDIVVVQCVACGVGMIVGGSIHNLIGIRSVCLFGGWLVSSGTALLYFAVDAGYSWILSTLGVMVGMGVGISYTAPLCRVLQWLPEHKGVAIGFVLVGFSSGPFLTTWIWRHFVDSCAVFVHSFSYPSFSELTVPIIPIFPSEEICDVPIKIDNFREALLLLGAGTAILQVVACALFLRPDTRALFSRKRRITTRLPRRMRPIRRVETVEMQIGGDIAPKAMLFRKSFWFLWLAFLFQTTSITFASSRSATFAANRFPKENYHNAEPFFLLTQAVGSVICGYVMDTVSVMGCVVFVCTFSTIAQAAIYWTHLPHTEDLMFCCLLVISSCFGATITAFPCAVLHRFGAKHFAANFSLLWTANVVGSILAVLLGEPVVVKKWGDKISFLVFAVIGAVGALFAVFVVRTPRVQLPTHN